MRVKANLMLLDLGNEEKVFCNLENGGTFPRGGVLAYK